MSSSRGKIIGVGAAAALVLKACTPSAPQIAEITASVDDFWSAWAQGAAGFDRGMAMFDDRPDFALASDGATWRSKANVDEAFRPLFQTIDHQVFDMQPPAVAVFGPDLASVTQEGTFTQFSANGTSVGPLRFAATMILGRSGSGWRVRLYHQSEPQPPAPSWEEGTWAYTGDLRGQSINAGGRWSYLYGPADGSGPMTAEAGTYVVAGDTATNTVTFSTDAGRVGQVFRYTPTAVAGDTLSYAVMDADGRVTGQGRAVRVR